MKLFNNVLVYQLTDTLMLRAEQLDEYRSQDPGPLDPRRLGFIEPTGVEGAIYEPIPFQRSSYDYENPPLATLLTMREVKRDLSGKAVRRAVTARVKEIERAEVRKVGGREKAQIKQEVTGLLLPRAPLVDNDISALIHGDRIYVGTTSHNRAEDLLSLLRNALGSLPVKPLNPKVPPGSAMSVWLQFGDTGDERIQIGNSFKAEDIFEKGSKLSGSHLSLSEEALADLREGMGSHRSVTELGLIFQDPDSDIETPFTLTSTMQIKGIEWPEEFGDRLHEEVGEDGSLETASRASHMLVLSGLVPLVAAVTDALGGLHEHVTESEDDNNEDLL